ncbi:MAG: hypothetical protein ACLPVW_00985 [Terriglobales bacterium]
MLLTPLRDVFAAEGWIVREDSIGPVKVGMTRSQLSAALREKLVEEESGNDSCFFVHARGHDHVSFMIIGDRVVRIDIDAPGYKTSMGIQVGDLEAYARRVYGSRMKVTRHQYLDTGHYLTVRSSDGRHGVRFETDNGKITRFYAGTYEAIQYVEGCE